MRNNCQLTEKQDSFAFESRGVRLSFCGKSGALKEITCGEARLAPNGLDECVLLVGGETVSSVDPDKLNVNWAKCFFKGAYTVGKNASFTAKTVEDTRDGVQITVETAFADFRLKKHYEITADGEIVRRFTLTYLGKSELRLRGAAVYTPSAAGMEQADWPGAGVPGTYPIPEKAECPVAENGLDLTPGDGLIGGGGETLILHTDSRFVSVYNENLSREASTTAAFMTESGAAVQQRLKVSAILAQGDTVSFGGLRIRLGTGRWLDAAGPERRSAPAARYRLQLHPADAVLPVPGVFRVRPAPPGMAARVRRGSEGLHRAGAPAWPEGDFRRADARRHR